MRSTLVLAFVLAVVAVCDCSVIKANSRDILNVGYITAGDRLLYRYYDYRPAIVNSVQYEDVVFRSNAMTRITAIQASEVGGTQWGSAYVINGGLGYNNVTIRFQSHTENGYYYQLVIWGL